MSTQRHRFRHINASHLQEKSSVSLLSAGLCHVRPIQGRQYRLTTITLGFFALLEWLAEPLFMRLWRCGVKMRLGRE